MRCAIAKLHSLLRRIDSNKPAAAAAPAAAPAPAPAQPLSTVADDLARFPAAAAVADELARSPSPAAAADDDDDLCLLRSPSADPAISGELALSEEVLAIIDTVPTIESPLDCLAHRLTPHVVAAVLDAVPALPPAFRFFVWASSHRSLRSWPAHNRIIALLRASDPAAAWDTLRLLHSHSIPIPAPAFTVLISAADSPEKSLHAFACMRDFGCRPDTFTYNTVLRLMVEEGVGILAMSLYGHMLKSHDAPNRATYNILIDWLCKSGKMEDAFQLFSEMLKSGISPNTTLYTVFLSAQCRSNKVDEAIKLLNEMREKGYRPDFITYSVLFSGYCKSGRIEEALEHLALFREDGFSLVLSGYKSLIDGLFRCGRFNEACRYYTEMLEKNVVPDCALYTIMMRAYMKVGRIDDAVSFLSEMTARGIFPETSCYNTLIKGFCDAGLLDRARDLKLEISRNGSFPDSTTYTIMICGLCNEGLVNEAQQVFEEMGIVGCVPTVSTFNSLINGLCKARKLDEARVLFYKMEMGRNPCLFLRLSQGSSRVRDSDSLRRTVDQLCQSGEVVKAYKLLRDILQSGVMPDLVTYNILINGMCKVGNIEVALKILEELQLKGHSPDVITYGTLIDGLLKVDREADAERVFQNMLRRGCSPNLTIINTFMKPLCILKKVSQAIILWLDCVLKERKHSREAEAIQAAQKHFQQGNVEDVVRTLVEIDRKCDSVNSFPYTCWLIGYCQVGNSDEALKIFSILSEFNIDVTPACCVHLIGLLCRERMLAPALDVMMYALRKGFFLETTVVNHLIRYVCMQSKKDALELSYRMRLAGYDLDTHLWESTKALLYNDQACGN